MAVIGKHTYQCIEQTERLPFIKCGHLKLTSLQLDIYHASDFSCDRVGGQYSSCYANLSISLSKIHSKLVEYTVDGYGTFINQK